jgi:uncharacterized membrane protein HdeD (DUF308 family)
MNLVKRVTTKTPLFFKKVRNLGLILAAVSGAILAAPVALPTAIVAAAGYVALVGGVMSAVSQTAVVNEPDIENDNWRVNNFIKNKDDTPYP